MCALCDHFVLEGKLEFSNLPGHEVSLYCVFLVALLKFAPQEIVFSCNLITLVIFTQDQKGDPLNVLSSIL